MRGYPAEQVKRIYGWFEVAGYAVLYPRRKKIMKLIKRILGDILGLIEIPFQNIWQKDGWDLLYVFWCHILLPIQILLLPWHVLTTLFFGTHSAKWVPWSGLILFIFTHRFDPKIFMLIMLIWFIIVFFYTIYDYIQMKYCSWIAEAWDDFKSFHLTNIAINFETVFKWHIYFVPVLNVILYRHWMKYDKKYRHYGRKITPGRQWHQKDFGGKNRLYSYVVK